MADKDNTPKKELSAADVAKLVKRRTLLSDKGVSREVVSPLKADEILAWHDHGTHVVAVTKDGQKFSNADTAAEA